MRELRDQLFDEAGSGEYILTNDVTSLRLEYYFGAGLIFGKYVRPNYNKGELSLQKFFPPRLPKKKKKWEGRKRGKVLR